MRYVPILFSYNYFVNCKDVKSFYSLVSFFFFLRIYSFEKRILLWQVPAHVLEQTFIDTPPALWMWARATVQMPSLSSQIQVEEQHDQTHWPHAYQYQAIKLLELEIYLVSISFIIHLLYFLWIVLIENYLFI